MFGNFLIGLREGLEAALIVSILVAYLVRVNRRDRLPLVATGVAVAVALSVSFGALLTFTSTTLLKTFRAQEIFGGVMSIVAVAVVTWMVFWMRRTARHLRRDLDGKLGAALAGGALAVALMAFFAVAREGLETAVFFWSAVQAAGSTAQPVVGFVLGIVTAVVLAWLLYRKAVTLNLASFFTWTGAGLIVIAAGVLAYGVHDLQEGGVIGGLNVLAFDVSAQIPPGSWYGTLLKGVFNFSPQTTVAQAIAWVAYLVPVMLLFFAGLRRPATAPTTTAPATTVPAANAPTANAPTANAPTANAPAATALITESIAVGSTAVGSTTVGSTAVGSTTVGSTTAGSTTAEPTTAQPRAAAPVA